MFKKQIHANKWIDVFCTLFFNVFFKLVFNHKDDRNKLLILCAILS